MKCFIAYEFQVIIRKNENGEIMYCFKNLNWKTFKKKDSRKTGVHERLKILTYLKQIGENMIIMARGNYD